MLDKGYQDVEFYTEFRCAENCDAGVLLRAEKTPEGGWKGVYVSLSGEGGAFDLTLNADGKELNRTRLLRATAQFARMAAGPWTNGAAHVPGFASPAMTLAEEQEEASKPPAAPAAGRGGGPRWPAATANQAGRVEHTRRNRRCRHRLDHAQRTPRGEFGDQRPHDGLSARLRCMSRALVRCDSAMLPSRT